MAICDTCGNNYARAFAVVTSDGRRFSFDSIECAAAKVAPECAHCGCRILGHGIEAGDTIYCCANCARDVGEKGAVDNTRAAA